MIPILVTADARVAEWAARTAIPSVPDPGNGLSEAAAAGARWANRGASRWIILHSDLPLLSAPDLNTFWERALEADAIAPSSDGGTSAITSRGPMEFSYGPGSFSRHLADLDNPSIVATTGFLHDLDSPADLESVCDHPRGRWLLDVIG